MVVLWTPNVSENSFLGVYEGSFLYWAHSLLASDNLKTIRSIIPFRDQPIFILAFETFSGLLKGLILRFSVNAQDRVMGEMMLESGECPDLYVDVSPMKNDGFRISSLCRGNTNYVRRWDFHPNGPFLRPLDLHHRTSVKVGDNHLKLTFARLPQIAEGSFYIEDLLFHEEQKPGIRTKIDLEDRATIYLDGAIETIELNSDVPGIEFLQRVSMLDSQMMLQDNPVLNQDLQMIAGSFKAKPIFSFDNFYYFEDKLELTNNVKQCKEIRIMKDHPRKDKRMVYLLLCRSSVDFSFVITDTEHVRIPLGANELEPNLLVGEIFAVIDETSIRLFVHFENTLFLRYLWLQFDFAKWEGKVQYTDTLTLEAFPTARTSIESVYIYPDDRWITVFYHLKYSSEIKIKCLDPIRLQFDPVREETIRFYDVRETTFYIAKFFMVKDGLRALLTNEQFIYEIKFVQFTEWDYTIMAKYFVKEGLSQINVKMSISKNFLAVLVNPHQAEHNIYVYKKGDSETDMILPFYYVGRKALGISAAAHPTYWILNFILLEDKISHETSLHVVTLRDMIDTGPNYASLHKTSLAVQHFSLILDFNELGYMQTVSFKVIRESQNIHTVKMNIKIYANFKYTILIWILTAFISLFVILVLGVIYTHRQNVKLQRKIEAKLLDIKEHREQVRQREAETRGQDRSDNPGSPGSLVSRRSR
jgi:hypothetical protein